MLLNYKYLIKPLIRPNLLLRAKVVKYVVSVFHGVFVDNLMLTDVDRFEKLN